MVKVSTSSITRLTSRLTSEATRAEMNASPHADQMFAGTFVMRTRYCSSYTSSVYPGCTKPPHSGHFLTFLADFIFSRAVVVCESGTLSSHCSKGYRPSVYTSDPRLRDHTLRVPEDLDSFFHKRGPRSLSGYASMIFPVNNK